MTKANSALTQLILLSFVCIGCWLALGAGVSFYFGLILGISSFIVLAVVVRRENARPLTQKDAASWNYIRARGKREYIRKILLSGLILAVTASTLVAFSSIIGINFSARNLGLFFALIVIFIIAFYLAAVRTWESNERKDKKP